MNDVATLLRTLRHGDSSFPSGAASFSWGLERLQQDALVRSKQHLESLLEEQLRFRWACSDRCALASAWQRAGDAEEVLRCDRVVEGQTLAAALRAGSRRCGRALLSMHVRLGTRGADGYSRRVREHDAPAHLAVMQGFLWRMSELPLNAAEVISAWSACWALASAAVRLALVTHVEAQHVLARVEPVIDELMQRPALPIEQMHAFSPAAEIATMRHECSDTRLFSN